MQTQFQYIVKLAEQYQEYSDKTASLYKAINNLSIKYQIHIFFIKTVNLNTNWRSIERRLKGVVSV